MKFKYPVYVKPHSKHHLCVKIRKKNYPCNVGKSSLYCGTFPSRLVRQKIIELYVTVEHT